MRQKSDADIIENKILVQQIQETKNRHLQLTINFYKNVIHCSFSSVCFYYLKLVKSRQYLKKKPHL